LPSRAALPFFDGLTVRTKSLVGPSAPENAAGELVILLSERLMVHFFATQIPARNF
jgi:hypothetical protein